MDEYVRPAVTRRLPRGTQREGLRAFGLDVAYERAEGCRLFYHDPREHAVWDFLGGYGSTLFGHNHPALVREVCAFLERGGVVHGQASRRAASEDLAAELARRLRAATGGAFELLLANTGSEAVELAAKHALAACAQGREELARRLAAPGPPGPRDWSPEARALLRLHGIEDGPRAWEQIAAHNRRVLHHAPLLVAVAGSYHGMSSRALALTDDPLGRFGRGTRLPDVRFVSRSQPDDLARLLQESQGTLLRVHVGQADVGLEAVAATPVAAFFIEPIQGEGGIHPVPLEVARAWQAACREHGVPLVADEIQSGLGRSGSFLYCEQLGLRPDYVLLGKSLGGGLTKLSAVAIAAGRFLPGFTLQHASTFAGDELSSRVALSALALLDEEHGARRAAALGSTLLARLRALAERHPDAIADVRGCGLMIGIEWRASRFERSNTLADLQAAGLLGYLLAGYLLRAHGLRVAPTLASNVTIRLEPAYAVPHEALDCLLAGLEQLCLLLERQDAASLLAPCLGHAQKGDAGRAPLPVRQEPVRPRRLRAPLPEAAHVGFIAHLVEARDLARWDPAFGRLGPQASEAFLERLWRFVEPVLMHRDQLTSVTGRRVTLSCIGLAVPSARFQRALRTAERAELRRLVQSALDLATDEGCSVVGLGGYASIVTRNGKELHSRGPALTTGNGYAVAAGLEAMRAAARELDLDARRARAAVVGATGNIGAVFAELLAHEVRSLVLIGRESRREDLEALCGRIAWGLAREAPAAPMARALAGLRLPAEPPDRLACAGLYRGLRDALGADCPLEVGSDPGLCREATLIASASNQTGSVLFPEHIAHGPVVIADLAVPADVDASVARARPEARVIRGGVIRTPCDAGWSVPGVPLEPGEMYACMAETVLMGLEGHTAHGSFGRLTPGRVRETLAMAARHGFSAVRSLALHGY